jgi:hypothetical protein
MQTPLATSLSDENRRAPRLRCFRGGRCVFNKGFSDLNVLVRNISSTGAKLTGDELKILPREFELQISDGLGSFAKHLVQRVWSNQDSVGVIFIDAARSIDGTTASGDT